MRFLIPILIMLTLVNIAVAEHTNVECTDVRYGIVGKNVESGIMADMAVLEFSFKNNSNMRTVTGIKYNVTLRDPFGEILSQQKLQFNCKIMPGSTSSDQKMTEDNPLIREDLYDKTRNLIVNGTLGISVDITQIAYDTGLVKDNDDDSFVPQNEEELEKLLQKAQELYQGP